MSRKAFDHPGSPGRPDRGRPIRPRGPIEAGAKSRAGGDRRAQRRGCPERPEFPFDRTDPAERPVRRFRRPERKAEHLLRGFGFRRPVEDGEQRADLRTALREPKSLLDRRHRRGPLRSGGPLARLGRGQQLPLDLLGRRGLQVRRRRQDLAQHGPQGIPSYRAHRHPPLQSRHRLCGRPGPSLLRESRPGRLQVDRRREDLGQSPRGQRRRPGRRRRRSGHGPVRPGDALCRGLRQIPQALDLGHRRSGLRHPQDGRRRQVLDQAHERPAVRHPRPDRPGRLRQGPEDRLRRDRERQQARPVRRGPMARGPGRQVERGHDRRRDLPFRGRRGDLDQGQSRRRGPSAAIRGTTTARSSSTRTTRTSSTSSASASWSAATAARPGRRRSASAATTTPCGSIPRTAPTCSSATITGWA